MSATVAGATATLRYDPLGRLFEVSSPSGTTEFLWDGDALVGEYDSAGTLTKRYVHGSGAGIDDPLVWYRDTNRRRLHADHPHRAEVPGKALALDPSVFRRVRVFKAPTNAPARLAAAGAVCSCSFKKTRWQQVRSILKFCRAQSARLLCRGRWTATAGSHWRRKSSIGKQAANRQYPTQGGGESYE